MFVTILRFSMIYILFGLLTYLIVTICEEDLEIYIVGIVLIFPIMLIYISVKQIVGLYRKITRKQKTYTEYIYAIVEDKNTSIKKTNN